MCPTKNMLPCWRVHMELWMQGESWLTYWTQFIWQLNISDVRWWLSSVSRIRKTWEKYCTAGGRWWNDELGCRNLWAISSSWSLPISDIFWQKWVVAELTPQEDATLTARPQEEATLLYWSPCPEGFRSTALSGFEWPPTRSLRTYKSG